MIEHNINHALSFFLLILFSIRYTSLKTGDPCKERYVKSKYADFFISFLLREPSYFRTLHYLMRHLNRVSERGPDTGMTAKNLAIVWAPNLLRSLEESLTGLASPTALTPSSGER